MTVQKQESIERLILRPWRHPPGNRQVAEKLHHLPFAHILRVTFSMKQDEAPDPSHIGPFRADAVVLDPQGTAYRIEKGRRSGGTHEAMKKGMVICWKSSAIGTILDKGARLRPGAPTYVFPSQGQAPGQKVTKVLRGNSGGPERKGDERPGIKAIESQGARKGAGACNRPLPPSRGMQHKPPSLTNSREPSNNIPRPERPLHDRDGDGSNKKQQTRP